MYFSTFALKLKINITILSDIVKQYPSLQMVTDCQFLPRETCSPERVQPKEITRPVIKKVIITLGYTGFTSFNVVFGTQKKPR
jgi:hypothetical protein